jgi:hypothetical protein
VDIGIGVKVFTEGKKGVANALFYAQAGHDRRRKILALSSSSLAADTPQMANDAGVLAWPWPALPVT